MIIEKVSYYAYSIAQPIPRLIGRAYDATAVDACKTLAGLQAAYDDETVTCFPLQSVLSSSQQTTAV